MSLQNCYEVNLYQYELLLWILSEGDFFTNYLSGMSYCSVNMYGINIGKTFFLFILSFHGTLLSSENYDTAAAWNDFILFIHWHSQKSSSFQLKEMNRMRLYLTTQVGLPRFSFSQGNNTDFFLHYTVAWSMCILKGIVKMFINLIGVSLPNIYST